MTGKESVVSTCERENRIGATFESRQFLQRVLTHFPQFDLFISSCCSTNGKISSESDGIRRERKTNNLKREPFARCFSSRVGNRCTRNERKGGYTLRQTVAPSCTRPELDSDSRFSSEFHLRRSCSHSSRLKPSLEPYRRYSVSRRTCSEVDRSAETKNERSTRAMRRVEVEESPKDEKRTLRCELREGDRSIESKCLDIRRRVVRDLFESSNGASFAAPTSGEDDGILE